MNLTAVLELDWPLFTGQGGVRAPHGEMRPYLAAQAGTGRSGVAAIGIARSTPACSPALPSSNGIPWFAFTKAQWRVTCFYFYLWDADFVSQLHGLAAAATADSTCGDEEDPPTADVDCSTGPAAPPAAPAFPWCFPFVRPFLPCPGDRTVIPCLPAADVLPPLARSCGPSRCVDRPSDGVSVAGH